LWNVGRLWKVVSSTMSEDAIVFWFFAVLFVLRAVAATFVYAWLLSDAPECPSCGATTLHVERRLVQRLFPRLRPSWCPACGWEGLLHPPPAAQPPRDSAKTDSQPGQLPLISKKSSK
jgi:hypothetical protein